MQILSDKYRYELKNDHTVFFKDLECNFFNISFIEKFDEFEVYFDRIVLKKGFRWEGCSPKIKINVFGRDIWIGTPDFGEKTYLASGFHDAIYLNLDDTQITRKQADLLFLHLMKKQNFELAYPYYYVVRALGGYYHSYKSSNLSK